MIMHLETPVSQYQEQYTHREPHKYTEFSKVEGSKISIKLAFKYTNNQLDDVIKDESPLKITTKRYIFINKCNNKCAKPT